MRANRKTVIAVIAGTIILLVGIIGGGYLLTGESRKEFPADGYVLEVVSEENTQNVSGLTFSVGTQYRGKFPSSYIFKDIQGKRNTVDAESFIHYSDGSLSAFCDGMTVNMQEVGQGFLEFYRVKKGMVMTRASEGWQIDNNQNIMPFPEMLWQISDNKVLAASDEMTLELSGREAEKVSGYLEVTWLDRDVVQVVNQDAVYQTVVTGGKITYGSGSVLNLEEASVLDGSGEVCFTLGELQADMADGGISIQSESAANWQPPEFNIQTEDGKDGEAGKSGEIGEDGEIGENGEDGEIGEDGESGAEGKSGEQGRTGDQGKAGEQGKTGEQGKSGAQGEAGETGESGGTGAGGGSAGSGGGSGGSGGGSGSAGNGLSASLGTIRVTKLDYDCASAHVELAVSDEHDTLLYNKGVVEIRDKATNKIVGQYSGTNADLGGDGLADRSFDFKDKLTADREYTLIVKNDYEVELQGGVKNTGTKTFIKRDFFTSTEGVTMEVAKKEEGQLMLNLKKLASSGVNYYSLRITSGDLCVTYPEADGGSGSASIKDEPSPVLNISEWLQNKRMEMGMDEDEGTDLTSNLPYTIELYTSDQDDGWSKGSDGVPEGYATNKIKKSVQVLEGRTLKEKPQIGTVSSSLSNDGYYDLAVSVLSDKDMSIKNFKFLIEKDNGDGSATLVRELNATSNKVKWYYGDSLPGGTYKVNCEVTYYDNEKDNIVNAVPTAITATSTGSSVVTFLPYQRSADGKSWVNSFGDTVAEYDLGGSSTVNANRIWGDLRLLPNGRKIVGGEVTVKVTSSGKPQYERTMILSLGNLHDDNAYYIPVKCLGLKADTVYTFDITGLVESELNIAESETSTSIKTTKGEWLGSASVKTDSLNGISTAENSSTAVFEIESMINVEGADPDAIAAFWLYTANNAYGDMNSTDPKSPGYFERSIARAVRVDIYAGTSYLGTIIKDMYEGDPEWADVELALSKDMSEEAQKHALEAPSGYSKAEGDFFFNGPLVSDTGRARQFMLTKSDFINAGVRDIGTRRGNITLEITEMYDYSYNLVHNSESYGTRFIEDTSDPSTAPYYNTVPLQIVNILNAEGVSEKTLNVKEIYLGETPPSLIDPPDTAVKVEEIKNYTGNMVGYTDPKLKSDTTIGLKVQSKYPNANSEMTSITYYAMTMDAYVEHSTSTEAQEGMDIIQKFRASGSEESGVKFGVTLGSGSFTIPDGEGVPPLYVVFTEDKTLLARCKTVSNEDSGNQEVIYQAYKDPSTGNAIFYANSALMERGHCYVFAYTLRSLYHVNTETEDDPVPWEFPYEINTYVSTQNYSSPTLLQRSEGTEVYKETPRVAVYLDHTVMKDEDSGKDYEAHWNYLVYDPDGAFLPAEGDAKSVAKIYAGGNTQITQQVNKDNLGGSNSNLLTAETLESVNVAVADYEKWKDIYVEDFGMADGVRPDADTVKQFTVKLSDGIQNAKLASFGQTAYEIWLRVDELTDEYTVKEEKYLDSKKALSSNALDSLEHFAILTVKHRFDAFSKKDCDSMKSLGVNVSIPEEGGDNLNVQMMGSLTTGRVVGFYYELRDKKDKTKLLQCGFMLYSDGVDGGSMEIPLDYPETNSEVVLTMEAVYDQGVAGLNPDEIHSELTLPKSDRLYTSSESESLHDTYFALQTQDAAVYADSVNQNSHKFGYTSVAARDSLMKISNVRRRTDGGDGEFLKGFTARKWNGVVSVEMTNRYSAAGSYIGNDNELPVWKALGQTEITMNVLSENRYIKKEGDEIVITVPPVTPNFNSRSATSGLFHSSDVSVKFTKKSVETLLTADGIYGKEVYFELYDADEYDDAESDNRAPVPLENTDNRYFAIPNEKPDQFANLPTEMGSGGSDVKAYLIPERIGTECKLDYKVAIRNLDMDKKYYLKMYCYREKSDGTREKVYIVDNMPIGGVVTSKEYKQLITTVKELNVGSRVETGTSFQATFKQEDYEQQSLETAYNLTPARDFYLQYELQSADGKLEIDPDKMMSYLGYGKKEMTTHHYYDGGWKTFSYPVYKKEVADEIYQIGNRPLSAPDKFVFPQNVMTSLGSGSHYLVIRTHDLNGGQEIANYKQDNNNLESGVTAPRVTFTIPERKPIEVNAMVRYSTRGQSGSDNKGEDVALLTVMVTDSGFRLGVMDGGTLKMGNYRVKLSKRKNSSEAWQEVLLSGSEITITPNRLDAFFKPSDTGGYVITYPVQDGEFYRLEVYGVDILGANPAGETCLYDSENTALKDRLAVADLEKPQIENADTRFEKGSGEYVLRVKNGKGLEHINTVKVTLLLEKDDGRVLQGSDTIACAFGAANSKGWQEMRIPLQGILDNWKDELTNDDQLMLSVQYMNNDNVLTSGSYIFAY